MPERDIDVDAQVALCRPCGEVFRLDDLLDLRATPCEFDVNAPPQGAWVRDDGGELRIGATTRSKGAAILLPLALAWLVSTGSLWREVLSSPRPGDVLPWVYGGLCVAGTPVLLAAFLVTAWGKVEVRLRGEQGEVFTGVGPVGWRRLFARSHVTGVRIRIPALENQQMYWPGIVLRGRKPLRLGTLLSHERRYFLWRALRTVLGSGGAAGAPLRRGAVVDEGRRSAARSGFGTGARCRKCRRPLRAREIAIENGAVLCPACAAAQIAAESAGGRAASAPQVCPPPGAWYRKIGDEVRIGASTRSAEGLSISLLFLAGCALVCRQTATTACGFVFFGVFFAGGAVALLMAVAGKVEVRLRAAEGEIFTGLGPLGWPRGFVCSGEVRVSEGVIYTQGGSRPCILLEAERPIRFGTGLSVERRDFVLHALRATLRGWGSRAGGGATRPSLPVVPFPGVAPHHRPLKCLPTPAFAAAAPGTCGNMTVYRLSGRLSSCDVRRPRHGPGGHGTGVDMKTRGLASGALALLLCAAAGGTAQAQLRSEVVGQWGGAVQTVVVEGTRAYVGVGTRLHCLDLTDPNAPVLLGQSPPLPGLAQRVAVAGAYAYVANTLGGLQVLDVSNPAAPAVVGAWCAAETDAQLVAVVGGYVVLSEQQPLLRILDVSNPAVPFQTGVYNLKSAAYGMAVLGHYVIVAESTDGVEVVDISNPWAPARAAELELFDARDVAVWGSYAYVAGGQACAAFVLDLNDPSAPALVSSLPVGGTAFHIAATGNRLHVYANTVGMPMFDLSDPAAPVQIAELRLPFDVLASSGDVLYLARPTRGLWIVNISDPAAPLEHGMYTDSDGVFHLDVADGYAYIAAGPAGLQVIDARNPAELTHVADIGALQRAVGIRAIGSRAYLLDVGVQLIDIADPQHPARRAHLPISVTAVTALGEHAFMGAGDGFSVYDVSDMTQPNQVGRYNFDRYDYDPPQLAAAGGYVYATVRWENSGYALEIVDVNNPAAPLRVGVCPTSAWVQAMCVAGRYAYVNLVPTAGLEIIDVASSASPVRVGGLTWAPGTGSNIAITGRRVYTALQGLQVLDVSDPAAPVWEGSLPLPTNPYITRVAADGGHVFVGSNSAGLLALLVGPGTLTIDTTPIRGEVFVDGVRWGLAPQSRRISGGTYEVSFAPVAGYPVPGAQLAKVVQDQTTTITGDYLPPTTGTLLLDTTPVKGEVFVDGVTWGVAPQSRELPAGPHQVTFGPVAGYLAPAEQTATVTGGQTTSATGTYVAECVLCPDPGACGGGTCGAGIVGAMWGTLAGLISLKITCRMRGAARTSPASRRTAVAPRPALTASAGELH